MEGAACRMQQVAVVCVCVCVWVGALVHPFPPVAYRRVKGGGPVVGANRERRDREDKEPVAAYGSLGARAYSYYYSKSWVQEVARQHLNSRHMSHRGKHPLIQAIRGTSIPVGSCNTTCRSWQKHKYVHGREGFGGRLSPAPEGQSYRGSCGAPLISCYHPAKSYRLLTRIYVKVPCAADVRFVYHEQPSAALSGMAGPAYRDKYFSFSPRQTVL